jgi:hypothetical protein
MLLDEMPMLTHKGGTCLDGTAMCSAIPLFQGLDPTRVHRMGSRDSHMLPSKGCKGLGGLPYTENRENNQSAFRLPSG